MLALSQGQDVVRNMNAAYERSNDANGASASFTPLVPAATATSRRVKSVLAVKMQLLDNAFAHETLHEDKIMCHVSGVCARMVVPALCDVSVLASTSAMGDSVPFSVQYKNVAVAPRFVIGATISSPENAVLIGSEAKWRVTVMEFLHTGVPLGHMDGCNAYIAHCIFYNLVNSALSIWNTGIVHSDMHPWNVLVLPDYTVRLIDFGLAINMKRQTLHSLRKSLRPHIKHATELTMSECTDPDDQEDEYDEGDWEKSFQEIAQATSSVPEIRRVFTALCMPHLRQIMGKRGIIANQCHFDAQILDNLHTGLPTLPISATAVPSPPPTVL